MKFKAGYYYDVDIDELMIVYPDGSHDVEFSYMGKTGFLECHGEATECYEHYHVGDLEFLGEL